MFELTDVVYRDVLRVDSMIIQAGSVTAVVGESGGGKSTLLKLLNKTLSPDKGSIRFEGEDLASRDSVTHRRRVVYLNQTPYLFPGTIRSNLQQGLFFQGRGEADQASLAAVLEEVGLDKSLDGDVKRLSGGERQRLALARVLLLGSDVLLLDEPSGALDDDSEDALLAMVVRLARERGKTLVMVTHSKAQARKHADHLFVVQRGRIEEVVSHGE